jgi:uncharacterized protein (DUF433 family)/transcriptional regulator with XRE-family HTH domain
VARRVSGLSQAELARRGRTSQATISAYERGLKSPSLNVTERLLDVMGCELMLHVRIDFEEYHPEGIAPFWAPNLLWRVQTPDCFDTLRIPDLLQHTPQEEWNLKDRTDRRRAYEILIRRGLPQQMIRWLDGALLVDLWDELDLPDPVRKVWWPAIAVARDGKLGVDTLNWHGQDPEATAYARVRGYESLPSPPPPPPTRRSRFDPRPRPDTRSARVGWLMSLITINPLVGHDRPAVRDTGVRVTDVLSMLVAGADEAAILEDHPDLTSEDIKACLTYAAAKVDPSVVAAP